MGLATRDQCAPASVVRRIVPPLPAIHPSALSSANPTARRSLVTPLAIWLLLEGVKPEVVLRNTL